MDAAHLAAEGFSLRLGTLHCPLQRALLESKVSLHLPHGVNVLAGDPLGILKALSIRVDNQVFNLVVERPGQNLVRSGHLVGFYPQASPALDQSFGNSHLGVIGKATARLLTRCVIQIRLHQIGTSLILDGRSLLVHHRFVVEVLCLLNLLDFRRKLLHLHLELLHLLLHLHPLLLHLLGRLWVLLHLLLHLLLELLHLLLGLLHLLLQLLLLLNRLLHVIRAEQLRTQKNLLPRPDGPLGVTPVQDRTEQCHQLKRLGHRHPEARAGVCLQVLVLELRVPHEPAGRTEERHALVRYILKPLLVLDAKLDLAEPSSHNRSQVVFNPAFWRHQILASTGLSRTARTFATVHPDPMSLVISA